jgi:hypothetical protein
MSYLPNLPEDDEAWTARMRTLYPQGLPEPQPFFFTRLQARLEAQPPTPAVLPTWLRRPAYAFSLGALVLALNAGAAVYYVRQQRAGSLPQATAEGYAAFAAEYQLDPFHISHE